MVAIPGRGLVVPRAGAVLALVVTAATVTPCRARGMQGTGDVRVEAGTATALPAEEVNGDAAVYGMTGVSLDWTGERTEVEASIFGGLALDGLQGGDFASAVLRLAAWSQAPPGVALGVAGRVYGFSVGDPFPYRNGTLQVGPALRWARGPASVELRGEIGAGASVVELRRSTDRASRHIDQHLWHRGGILEARLGRGALTASVTAGAWTSAGGAFRALELALTGGGRRLAVRGDVGVWDTGLGTEWVGGLGLVLPLGGRWSVSAAGGRAGPDPLTLVEAGSQGGVLVGWRLAELGGTGAPGLYEIRPSPRGSLVRFRLERPEARRVELMGGFTGWQPLPMERDGDGWTLELEVAPGTHHFGFLVDGEWYVPEGVPGNVPDDWGRVNATLLVPPASQEREP